MRKNLMRRAAAVGAAACFVLIGAISMAEAGSVHTNPGGKYLGGSVAQFHTNPGGKYLGGSVAKFHTNPGGKYVYRGSDQTFHTNPRQIRVSRRVRQLRQPPARVLPQIQLLSLVWPPTLFLWRRVR